jgi:4-amino-4-deoxy-L-arabinose transferase-like glycosyltransferase
VIVAAALGLVLLAIVLAQAVSVGRLGPRVVAAGAKAGARVPRSGHREPRRSVLVGAVVGGVALRLLWVIWATRTPTQLRDPAEYLRIASGFGHGHLPRFADLDPSAYWPPGYSAILAPFVAVADRTAWFSPAFAASLVNVVAGGMTIVLTGLLAERWIGPRARNPAAWLVALCPALIYWTSTAHTETVFTTLFLGLIVLCGQAVDRGETRRWALIGIVFAAAFLVRSPAVIILVVPLLVVRSTTGRWRGALRPTGTVLVASLVLLIPWAVRNGVQVGVWSPASTNNAAAACFGHHDDAEARWDPSRLTPEIQDDCYGHRSPFSDARLAPFYEDAGVTIPDDLPPPDEPGWYRHAMGRAIRWAASHPVEEVTLSAGKVAVTWGSEGQVVDGARNYAEPGWAGRWHDPLGLAADLWLWIVGGLALLGLVLDPRCRRALPVWVPIVLFTVAIVGGVAEPHYRYPVVPLVAVLAAGLLSRDPAGVAP